MSNKSASALIRVCQTFKPRHQQTIDIEVTVSYGAKDFLFQLTINEAILLATQLMVEVNKRNNA